MGLQGPEPTPPPNPGPTTRPPTMSPRRLHWGRGQRDSSGRHSTQYSVPFCSGPNWEGKTRKMKTHGHKSGLCFYWCFYFRVSVWKKTFLCLPGYLCVGGEIMINARVGEKVRKRKSFLDPGEHSLVHSHSPPGPLSRPSRLLTPLCCFPRVAGAEAPALRRCRRLRQGSCCAGNGQVDVSNELEWRA